MESVQFVFLNLILTLNWNSKLGFKRNTLGWILFNNAGLEFILRKRLKKNM